MQCIKCDQNLQIDNKYDCENCDLKCCNNCFIKEYKKTNTCFSCNTKQSVQHINKFFPNYHKTCSICNFKLGTKKRILFQCEHKCEGVSNNPVCTQCATDWILGNNSCLIKNCKGILNSRNYCNICNKTYCKHCNLEKTKDHVCLQINIEKTKKENIEKHKNCNFNCLYCKKYFSLNFCRTFMNKNQFKEAIKIYSIIKTNEQLANKPNYIEKAKELNFEKRKESMIKEIWTEIQELDKKRSELTDTIRQVHSQVYEKDKNIKIFISHCPGNHCKGMLDKNHFCDICNKNYCKHCMKEKNSDHECNKDDLETIKLVKKGTKSCPNCGAVSEKMSGCYMVWCFFCKSIWDWSRHEVINMSLDDSRAHNPDLFRYLAENNIERYNMRLHPYLQKQRQLRFKFKDTEIVAFFNNILSFTNNFFTLTRHIDNTELDRYNINFDAEIEKLNAQYINGDLDLSRLFEKNHEICKKISYNLEILPEIQKTNTLFKQSIDKVVKIFDDYEKKPRKEMNIMFEEIRYINQSELCVYLSRFNTKMEELSVFLSRKTPTLKIFKNTITFSR